MHDPHLSTPTKLKAQLNIIKMLAMGYVGKESPE